MKDLYARLGLATDATAAEIAAAGLKSPEAAACARILANQSQREVYDRAYSTLKSVGILRHHLGLDSGESWFLTQYPDFAPRARSAARIKPAAEPAEGADKALKQPPGSAVNASAAPVVGVASKAAPELSGTPANSRKLLPIVLAAAVVIAILVFVVLL